MTSQGVLHHGSGEISELLQSVRGARTRAMAEAVTLLAHAGRYDSVPKLCTSLLDMSDTESDHDTESDQMCWLFHRGRVSAHAIPTTACLLTDISERLLASTGTRQALGEAAAVPTAGAQLAGSERYKPIEPREAGGERVGFADLVSAGRFQPGLEGEPGQSRGAAVAGVGALADGPA